MKDTTKKRPRGRPKTGAQPLNIQEHIFLDEATAAKLAQLARDANMTKSAYVRKLIQSQ